MDIEHFCEKKIKPLAELMDHDRRALKKGLRKLGKKKLLAVRAPKEHKGKGYSPTEYFDFTETLQSYSGALGFLQRQQQAAANFISKYGSHELKADLLPRMAKGKTGVGVSVSHLRMPSTPRVTGKIREDMIELNGTIYWVSGYKIFDYLVVGFFMSEREEEVMALLRFKKSKTFQVTKPLSTIALSSIQTVTIELKQHIIPFENMLSIQPLGSYQKGSTLLSVHFVNLSALARGFIRELEEEQSEYFSKLSDEYESCREAFLNRENDEEVVSLYAHMHAIATNLCNFTRFTKGARTVICPNSIERRYRELMLFGVIALDPKVIYALLGSGSLLRDF